MAQSTFSLSWDSHRNNICNGLSVLQQNEEFVDMTLAADGHHVKVHQMILALASPYIKDLISTAACPHPIIFFNKISYKTLSAILEYIYTGEVLVSMENLTDLIQAAKELHIKGLEEMDIEGSLKSSIKNNISRLSRRSEEVDNDEVYFEVAVSERNSPDTQSTNYTIIDDGIAEDSQSDMHLQVQDEDGMVVEEEITGDSKESFVKIVKCTIARPDDADDPVDESSEIVLPTTMQFTVSNQGSLQMILNRYMYYLKHSNRDNTRQWRCVDYLNHRKCPALLVTKEEVVVQRISAHSHPFHDNRILKKVFSNAVFTALHEAERKGMTIKRLKSKEISADEQLIKFLKTKENSAE